MADEPHFPTDAKVGSGDPEAPTAASGEAAAASAQARAHADAAGKAPDGKRNRHLMTGAAIGIGSAAIVAALLYAKGRNRS